MNTEINCRRSALGFSVSSNKDERSLYDCYRNILQRCNNPNHPRYADYGGRGIECAFTDLRDFFDEIGLRPSPDHSVDRIDNDRGYEPGNVRWATPWEQAQNRRTYGSGKTLH